MSESARAVVIPFGLEASVSYGDDTSAGPEAMLAASHQVELFDDELWAEACLEYGVATLREPAIAANIQQLWSGSLPAYLLASFFITDQVAFWPAQANISEWSVAA